VAITTSTGFYRAVNVGETLHAIAHEKHLGKSTATYHIEILSGSKLVATSTGTVFKKEK